MLDREDGATSVFPAYVVGAWQSGGEELGERLQMALGKENVVARAPHFWNEHTETLERYASTWDRDAFRRRRVAARWRRRGRNPCGFIARTQRA